MVFFYIRLGFYVIAALTALQTIVIVAIQSGEPAFLFRENGPLEWIQFSLAATAGVIFTANALRHAHYKHILLICGLFTLCGAVRELDVWSEQFVFEHAYKLITTPLLVLIAYLIWKHRRILLATMSNFCRTGPFYFLLFGYLLILNAQVIGQQEIWETLMGSAYMRVVKDAVEETSEIIGYLLLFFGALESFFMTAARQSVRRDLES